MSAYDEFLEFLTQNSSPEEVLAFKATPKSQLRANELTERNKAGILSEPEKLELEEMLKINRLVSRLKAKAVHAIK